jgi:hypothetical protein
MIGKWAPKLTDKMAGNQQFAAIKPTVFAAPGGGGVIRNHTGNIRGIHCFGHRSVRRFANWGWRKRGQPIAGRSTRSSTRVAKLAHYTNVMGMDAVRKRLEIRDDLIVRHVKLTKGRGRILGYGRSTAEHG